MLLLIVLTTPAFGSPPPRFCTPDDPHAGQVGQSPDFHETVTGSKAVQTTDLSGPIAPTIGQPTGALSGRIVFTSGGHGWTAAAASWGLQRPVLLEMNEDYGNVDQMNLFATYCFNAGATVVPMRPNGNQTNEVVLDNDDPAVTFSGAWSNSSSTIFYGSAGDVAYRFAQLTAGESATATYTPTIPAAGFYPVYTWVRHGSDRTFQLYRIRHSGGEASVRVPHHLVGNGWVYLGTYYFEAGANSAKGAVVVSNLQPSPTVGSVVIADAIRFGNGMGSVNRGFGVSSYPREEECSRYWVQTSLGQGQAATLYDPDLPTVTTDDGDDNVGAPIRMAREMNREAAENIYKRIYISFHSNAGGGRGVVGLWNDNANFPGTGTPNQFRLAQLTGMEVNNDLVSIGVPPLELAWNNRGSSITATQTFAFGEIRNDTLGGEMDATIIEVAFHDHASDAALLRDPKARNWIARAAYQAVVRYMNEFDAAPLTFVPEPPANVRAVASGSNVVVSWSAPVAQGGSGAANGYLVYQSTNGYGFGNPVAVGNVTSLVFTNLAANRDWFFRVAATNSGGQSMPSETVACRISISPDSPRVLIVNAFDRFEKLTNLRQTPAAQAYKPPGHDGNGGTIDRVLPGRNNSFDYVVAHAKAAGAAGWAYDSCQNEAVSSGAVSLGAYPVVIWACGVESTADQTFNSAEQARVSSFLAGGGGLFVSGSDVAWDLSRSAGPTPGDLGFITNFLHARLATDAQDDSQVYSVTPAAGSIFAGKPGATFDAGSLGIYAVRFPDILTPVGTGVINALNYGGGASAAAIQYDGSAGGGRVVFFGFPFETISSDSVRAQYLAAILPFLKPATHNPPSILVQPQSQFVVLGSNFTLTVTAAGASPLTYQWRFNGADLPGATTTTFTPTNVQPAHSGNYEVVVTNALGAITSSFALVQVTLPPALQTLFSDNFDVNTAANWMINRSSTDTRVTFNYDHAPDGIPASPNSSGETTRGVKFEANLVNGVTAAINISPVGRSFSGNYRLRFDLWINANGPFPLGGFGSTEHATAGLGTAGGSVQWNTGNADGVWFAVDGEGQATDTSATLPDWRAYAGTTLHAGSSGVYAGGAEANVRGNGHPYYASTFPGGQTAPALQQANYPQQTGALAVGTVGFAWRDVIISKTGAAVEWVVDGLKIAAVNNTTLSASNIFVGYWDSFPSLSDNPALSFGLVDNVRIETFITNVPPYITAQPKGVNAIPGSDVTFNVTAGGTESLAYQWRFNGTNLAGPTSSSYTRTNAQVGDAGNYSVVITNGSGSVTSSPALLKLTPPMPLRFDRVSLLPEGQVRLALSGAPGFTVRLQTSTNLADWMFLTNLANSSGSLLFTNAPLPGARNQFYRAQYP